MGKVCTLTESQIISYTNINLFENPWRSESTIMLVDILSQKLKSRPFWPEADGIEDWEPHDT